MQQTQTTSQSRASLATPGHPRRRPITICAYGVGRSEMRFRLMSDDDTQDLELRAERKHFDRWRGLDENLMKTGASVAVSKSIE